MALQRLTSEADTMLVAPLRFKSVLLEQMDRQIDRARRGLPASMILKNNSINDPQIINKISEASCAGVRVDMIVRGICCIKAGVPGKTENVHIRSIVGRYLEHSRIYCFGEGEDMTIYIASGDFLTRNTDVVSKSACGWMIVRLPKSCAASSTYSCGIPSMHGKCSLMAYIPA